MDDTLTLDGRAAIVTGAGNGLGRAEALALAAAGARLVLNDLPGNAVHETAAEIRAVRRSLSNAMACMVSPAKESNLAVTDTTAVRTSSCSASGGSAISMFLNSSQ